MGEGWGPTRSPAGKLSTQASLGCVSAPCREITRATFEAAAPSRLVQPSSLERLVHVSPLTPDGLGDLSDAHSFLAQRHNACAVESDWSALVNALRFRGVDAGALPIADEAKLHLGDHAQHSQDHAAHRAAGIDGRLQNPKVCAFFFPFVHEVENVARVPA